MKMRCMIVSAVAAATLSTSSCSARAGSSPRRIAAGEGADAPTMVYELAAR